MWIGWCLLSIWLLEIGSSNARIDQTPGLVLRDGDTAQLECNHTESHYYVFWYRQDANRGLQFLYYFQYRELLENSSSLPQRFAAEQPETQRLKLKISSVKQEDSAVYFCATSGGGNDILYFGKGTRLTVLGPDQDVSPPQVTVFAPPKQEVDEKEKATIVCLVTDFYPDHVALSWTVNNKTRTAGVKTEDPVYDNSMERYSMTSRLRITKEEWQNSDNKFVCRVSFHGTEGSTDYEDDINGADCGGGSKAARESYLTEANLGKLVYILLVFKSTLYGAFVMGLKLRKKLAL